MRLSDSGLINKGFTLLKKHDLIILFIVIFCVYTINFREMPSGDTLPACLLPFSILDQHTIFFDYYSGYIHTIITPYMFSVHGGHYVSQYPIVLPVLVTPLYIIPYIFLKFFHIPVDMLNPAFQIISSAMDKIAASFIADLSAIFLYLSFKNLYSKKISLFCTLIYAFATSTWAISSQTLWQQGAVELFLAVLIYLVVINEKQENRNNFLLMGMVSGLLFFCRPVDGILLLPILYYVFVHDKMDKYYYFLALILVSLPFAVYNLYLFGNFFGGYNSAVSSFSFNFEAINSFLGLMISPNRGLLIFSPICLLAIFGIFGIKKTKTKNMQYFLILMAISVLCQIIAYSFFKVWWGGWSYGPRLLTGTLPFIVFFLGIYFDEFSKTTWTQKSVRKYFVIFVITLFICWSVFVQVIGAFYYPKGGWEFKQNVDQIPQRLWSWNDSLILQNFWAGPYPINPIPSFQKLFSMTP